MNVWLGMVALVVAFDLPQRVHLLRRWPERVITVAATVTWIGLVLLAVVADFLLDIFATSAPTMQVGAAMVLVLWSVWMLFRWDVEPALTHAAGAQIRDGLVPGAFPILLTPVVGVMTISVSARSGMVIALLPVGMALAGLRLGRPLLARRGVRQLAAVIGVVAGIALMADGVLDV